MRFRRPQGSVESPPPPLLGILHRAPRSSNYYYSILNAETCPNTFHEGLLHSADRDDVFLKGTNITFTCPPGLVLSGPNTSMCMENGKWEPGTKEVKCKG